MGFCQVADWIQLPRMTSAESLSGADSAKCNASRIDTGRKFPSRYI